jgi:hypothetical protein
VLTDDHRRSRGQAEAAAKHPEAAQASLLAR